MVTGGKLISEDLGIKLENVKWEDLGSARKVTVDKDDTTIVVDDEDPKKKEAIAGRVKQIRKQVEDTTSDYDREKLQERLAKHARTAREGVCCEHASGRPGGRTRDSDPATYR